MFRRVNLPAAVSENPYSRFHFKETLLIPFGIKTKTPRPGISCKRLRMTVSKNPMSCKGVRFKRQGGAREKRESLGRRQPGFLPLNFYYYAAGMHVYESLRKQDCLRIDDEKETTALVYRIWRGRWVKPSLLKLA